MKYLLILSTIILGLAVMPACQTTKPNSACKCDPCTCASPCTCGQTASLGMMNDSCPMSGKKLSSNCPKSSYDGQDIGFCGNGCKAHFDNMTPDEKKAYVAKMQSGN